MSTDIARVRRGRVEEFIKRHRIGMVAMVFTDIVGSTRLKQRLGDRAAVQLMQEHHALLREWLAGCSEAEEIETAGDSFFLVFTRPSNAVLFALGWQQRLAEFARGRGVAIEDRIGIHVGEVFIQDREEGVCRKDLFGLQVDTCARICALADGRQILLTRFAFDAARPALAGDGPGTPAGARVWKCHGIFTLKGLDEPTEVFEVGEQGVALLEAPPDSEKAKRHQPATNERRLGWRPAPGLPVGGTSYVLGQRLGEGANGEVWAATGPAGERLAIKFAFTPEGRDLLRRSDEVSRRLRAAGPVPDSLVLTRGASLEELPAHLEMDLAEGGDLAGFLARSTSPQQVPLALRLEMAAQVAEALQVAHERGVTHFDLKPANVLLGRIPSEPGEVRVQISDFGVWDPRHTSGSSGSQTAHRLATPLYQSPEQSAAATEVGLPSDIYSLGALLYELLVGRPPFVRPSVADLLEAHRHEDPVFPRLIEPSIPDAAQRICLKCLEKRPRDRYRSAADVAADLRRILRGEPVSARPTQYDNFVATQARRHLGELERWRRDGMLTDGEFARIAGSYQGLERSGLEAVLESRRVHGWLVALLLGGWLLLDGAAIWLSLGWEGLHASGRLAVAWLPVVLVNLCGAVLWRLGSFRGAHLMAFLGAVALPIALGISWHTTHWFTATLGHPSLPLGRLSNLQLLAAGAGGLAWSAVLAWRSRTVTFSALSLAWLGALQIIWLDRLNLAELADDRIAVLAWQLLPLEAAAGVIGVGLALSRPRRRQAAPWLGAGLILFLGITMALAIRLPVEEWVRSDSNPKGVTPESVAVLQGVLVSACGVIYLAAGVALRRWFLVPARRAYLTLLWSAPLAALGGLMWCANHWIWTSVGVTLFGQLVPLPELVLVGASVLVVGVSARLQVRFFAFAGLVFLTRTEWRIADLYAPAENTAWPRLLLTVGLFLISGLSVREILSRCRSRREDIDDVAEHLNAQMEIVRKGSTSPRSSDP